MRSFVVLRHVTKVYYKQVTLVNNMTEKHLVYCLLVNGLEVLVSEHDTEKDALKHIKDINDLIYDCYANSPFSTYITLMTIQ